MPNPKFPVSILQSGIKLTNEPPKGMQANLLRVFGDVKEDVYNSCTKDYAYKKMFYALAFFHSVILERRKFGALGWNITYKWMDSDL